ncbi:hypothetical protein NA57DRAFT_52335 [Rhizodiscina lignyota]|uniref:F-box domain-containing protein n=1 Tax=Rhizodiscina lignyota TaxID=1504668 RepID=A0A9P4IMQ7_9PEZI|nr:hypothetical protein NA57DRAFT_52335 [Rhizodiscina lignyota]
MASKAALLRLISVLSGTLSAVSFINTTSSSSNQNKSFTDLPEEMIEEICTPLPDDDIYALRLTCRRLKENTLHFFKSKFFNIRKHMLTRKSLQDLIDLAHNSDYSRQVKTLILLLPRLLSHVGSGDYWSMDTDISFSQRSAYNRHLEDQNGMGRSGTDIEMLAEALASLPNLQDVRFAFVEGRYVSDTRFPGRKECRSWIALRKQIGCLIDYLQSQEPIQYRFLEDDIPLYPQLLLGAIDSCRNPVNLHSISIVSFYSYGESSSFILRVFPTITTRISTAVATVRTLRLKLCIDQSRPGVMPSAQSGLDTPLQGILCSLPQLEALSLVFHETHENFITTMYSILTYLAKLKSLELDYVTFFRTFQDAT